MITFTRSNLPPDPNWRPVWFRTYRGVYHAEAGDWIGSGRAQCGANIARPAFTHPDATQQRAIPVCKRCLAKLSKGQTTNRHQRGATTKEITMPNETKPTPCTCITNKGAKTLAPMGATTEYLLRIVAEDGDEAVGGAKCVALLRANSGAVWCLGCGGIRK